MKQANQKFIGVLVSYKPWALYPFAVKFWKIMLYWLLLKQIPFPSYILRTCLQGEHYTDLNN